MLDMPAENDILKFFMKKMSRNIFYRKLTENPHACVCCLIVCVEGICFHCQSVSGKIVEFNMLGKFTFSSNRGHSIVGQ